MGVGRVKNKGKHDYIYSLSLVSRVTLYPSMIILNIKDQILCSVLILPGCDIQIFNGPEKIFSFLKDKNNLGKSEACFMIYILATNKARNSLSFN